MEYPKALYHGGIGAQFEQLPCVVVNSAEDEAAKNAEGWFEIGKAPAIEEQNPEQDEAENLRTVLASKGVTADRRWGVARLREELAKVA